MSNDKDRIEELEKAVREALKMMEKSESPFYDGMKMLKQALTPKPQFKAGDLVQVRESINLPMDDWLSATFLEGDNESRYYVVCKNSLTVTNWRYCRKHPTKRNATFYKHDGGECPVDEGALIIYHTKYNSAGIVVASCVDWGIVDEYAIWSDDDE